MKRALRVALVTGIAFASSILASAEVTTVVLSNDPSRKAFTVKSDGKPPEPVLLWFQLTAPPTPNAKVKSCSLRVVPTTPTGALRRADQDVKVLWASKPVGGWSAYGTTPEPYLVPLQPHVCHWRAVPAKFEKDFPVRHVILGFSTESMDTAWSYHGGGAALAADRPRLIVTYDLPSPARTDVTTWKYKDPVSFFSVQWPKGKPEHLSVALLSNPVQIPLADGPGAAGMYFVAGPSNAPELYWVHDSSLKRSPLPAGVTVTTGSFAFLTPQQELKLITKDAVLSCDLNLGPTCNKASMELTVNEKETPAMGWDGSLYFKNVQAGGAVVALNPVLQEIWTTQLKLTAASPISLSASGRYAYVLATISTDSARRYLVRIDTATGETTPRAFEHCPSGSPPCEQPALQTLLRPAVVTRVVKGEAIDYVFVAGNTNEKGYLQLVEFGTQKPRMCSREIEGILSIAPVLSADEGSVYIASGGAISRYVLPDAAGRTGVPGCPVLATSTTIAKDVNVSALLLDGGGSIYAHTNKGLYVYQGSNKRWFGPQMVPAGATLQFAHDGTLIGYTANAFYDLSPRAQSPLFVTAFETRTIYSAETVVVRDSAAPKDKVVVIVKGNFRLFKPDFIRNENLRLRALDVYR